MNGHTYHVEIHQNAPSFRWGIHIVESFMVLAVVIVTLNSRII